MEKGRLPHVVIVGGGFGGLYAARALRKAPLRITLIDSRNHHLFQPLLYQVATASLNPSDIAKPIRSILRDQKNTTVLLEKANAVDVEKKKVLVDSGELHFDYLIVATGATHSYFGHDNWAADAPGLKTIEDALDIRRRVLLAYEAAEREGDPGARREWLNFVVVGGGPTGVELAGALAEISRHALARDFRRIDPRDARILLLEGGRRILPTYSEEMSARAASQLQRLGVEVRTSAQVTDVNARGVTVGAAETIAARTVLWGAGVSASPLVRSLGAPLDRAGRVLVSDDLSVPGVPSIFVIGDCAAVSWRNGTVPGVASAAMQEGKRAAANIVRMIKGGATEPFRFVDKGSLATIGRAAAVAELGPLRLSGLVAWMAWLSIHIFFLIGFRNRILVLIEWAWAYLTYEKGARLITGPVTPMGTKPDQLK
jgi:NADH dehydrogenase